MADCRPRIQAAVMSQRLKCHVCSAMRFKKDSQYETGNVNHCVLCNRDFCEAHKSSEHPEQVCEIVHESYYRNHSQIGGIYRNMAERTASQQKANQQQDQTTADS